jgi:glycine cleavage system aminomethyltransferase T
MPSDEPLHHVPTVPFDPTIATYTAFSGYQEPYEYTDWIDESMSWKDSCYIGDWSGLMKLRLKGPDAVRFFSDLAVNSFATFGVGQAKHAALCNEHGKLMGEGILMRWAEDEVFFTSGPGAMWADFKFRTGDYDAEYEVLTTQMSIQQVQGPNALALLQEATGEDLTDIRFMRFRHSAIDGKQFLLLRQGMAGEIGYELHAKWDEAASIYQRIYELGQKYGIRRLGGRTKMVNHVEACFPTPGVDYVPAWFDFAQAEELRAHVPPLAWQRFQKHGGSVETLGELHFSPVEMGWGKSVKFDHDFLGAQALRAELDAPRRVMRTLVWDRDDVLDVIASLFSRDETPYPFMEWPRGLLGNVLADYVLAGDERIGVATSRCYSYFFREMLSLAVLDVRHAEPGTEVEVLWGDPGRRQRRVRAVVAPAPYKKDNRRADVTTLAHA